MDNLTETQEAIVDWAKNNPESSGREIAREVGCSVSYANQVRREYLDAIIGENDLSSYTKQITFAHPYQILATKECLEELGLSDAEVVELEIERGTETIEVCAPVKRSSNLSDTRELHSYVYGVTELAPEVPEDIENQISEFLDDGTEDDVSIYTSDAFREYIDRQIEFIDRQHQSADILLGVGLVALGITDVEPESEEVNLPYYFLTNHDLRNVLSPDRPRLLDIRGCDRKITSVDKIVFESSNELSENNLKRMREKIREVGYLDLDIPYLFGNDVFLSNPQTLESNSGIIEISEANIDTSKIAFDGFIYGENEPSFSNLVEKIKNADFTVELGQKTHQISKEITKNPDRIYFQINSFTITLIYSDEGIFITLPTDIEPLRNLANGITNFISEEFDDLFAIDTVEITSEAGIQSDSWLFDTNAIYHQIIDDNSSSILKSVLPNMKLYDSQIIISWPVIYEINKHKDDTDSGPPPSVQEKGLDNLQTLKVLHEYDFINLSVDTIPENIQTKVSESHIADLHVLQKAQETEAVLISGDRRLRELAEISGTPVIDIHEYAEVEDTPDLSSEVWEEVHSQIGHELKTRKEILNKIDQKQSEAIERKYQNITNVPQPVPDSYLEQWVDEGDLIAYYSTNQDYDSGEQEEPILFDKAVDQDVVITPSVARELTNHIESYDDEKYLTKEILQDLSDILNLPGPGLPLITFHVPISNVLGPQSVSMGGLSTEARHFYQLKQVQNADYNVTEVEDSAVSEEVQASVKLARNRQYPILCTGADRYINPIGNLLGVDVRECSF